MFITNKDLNKKITKEVEQVNISSFCIYLIVYYVFLK